MALRRTALVAALLGAVALGLNGCGAQQPQTDEFTASTIQAIAHGRTCGAPTLSRAQVNSARQILDNFRGMSGAELAAVDGDYTIDVYFHVIYSEKKKQGIRGYLTQEQVQAQVDHLNTTFPTGVHFNLVSTDWTLNNRWFNPQPGSKADTDQRDALYQYTEGRPRGMSLNIYSNNGGGYLGWVLYFPWELRGASAARTIGKKPGGTPGNGGGGNKPDPQRLDGVTIHYGSIPGGELEGQYDEGDTATHEVGHWAGLYHTFQGGCNEPGDEVDDTPYEAGPNYYCDDVYDTCPQPGVDPIQNFMDYTFDYCMYEFSDGQGTRMDNWLSYRGTLL